MSIDRLRTEQRLDELLIDQAIGGLDASQQEELRALLAGETGEPRNPYMETAALVQLGMASMDRSGARAAGGGMPAELRRKLEAGAADLSSLRRTPADDVKPAKVIELTEHRRTAPQGFSTRLFRHAGWGVAAALALALVIVNGGQPAAGTPGPTPAQLLSDATTVVLPWSGAEPGYEAVSGDVVWNDDLQRGYMRLSGLPANNPAQAQYQLWIVDPERSAQPVDGGVFDMPADAREAIIPITAKLAVARPAAFAITLEQPGGVVVSAGPLLVLASGS